jgi:hypothetical protein
VRDGEAGPGAEERRERGVPAKHQDVDVEFVAEEVLEVRRGVNGRMVDLGGGHGLGGGDAFALSGLQFQLDAFFFRM